MPEELANDGQAETRACTDAREGVPQIMKSQTRQIGPFGNQRPRSLEVSTRFIVVGSVMRRDVRGARNGRRLARGLAPANRSRSNNLFEGDRKMRLRTKAHHGGHIGNRQLRIKKEPL
jgi:hypothetical protein